jgi:hypothetical protein
LGPYSRDGNLVFHFFSFAIISNHFLQKDGTSMIFYKDQNVVHKSSILGVALVSALISAAGFAGQERGNGGDVVICTDGANQTVSMEMFDHYEARTIRSIPIDLGPETLSPVAKAHLAVKRLEKFDPEKAQFYHAQIDLFMDKVWFVNETLPDLDDTGPIKLEPNCGLHQIAIHQKPESSFDREFWVYKPFWDNPKFNNNQKAALILHEIVFAKYIENGHLNSRKARTYAAM